MSAHGNFRRSFLVTACAAHGCQSFGVRPVIKVLQIGVAVDTGKRSVFRASERVRGHGQRHDGTVSIRPCQRRVGVTLDAGRVFVFVCVRQRAETGNKQESKKCSFHGIISIFHRVAMQDM